MFETSGWKQRGRPSSTGSFAPYAVDWHHTGTTTSTVNTHPTLNTCINGRSDLPGPLCHVLIGYDGTCHIVAAGRANHAGSNGGSGPIPAGDGNAQMVGFEIDYNGTQAMSNAQFDAATRASAACLKKFARSADYCRRHEETSTTGKWDTGGVTGSAIRAAVSNYLAGATAAGDEDDMPITDDDAEKIVTKLLGTKLGKSGPTVGVALQETYKMLPAGLLSTQLGSSGPTVGVALQSGYGYSKGVYESLDAGGEVLAEPQPEPAMPDQPD